MELEILYQDEYIVAVNKPPGLLVHRSMIDRNETQFAMQIVRDQIGQLVYTVHRLDKPTSGVLLFALSSDVARTLSEAFANNTIQKQYLAVVRGYCQKELVIDYPLKEKLDKIADKKAKKDKDAQLAVTHSELIDCFELPYAVGRYSSARASLLKLMPKTGRKHQLRRHMAHIRHPIFGDTTHGDGKQNRFIREVFGFKGLALTAISLRLTHPVSGELLDIQAPLDPRFSSLLTSWGWQPEQFEELRSNIAQWQI
ncbi:tRNA pseudouridine(65) synthase TruC [Alteromonadaceae bacterium M269]|nr:tRNA pseudouridine(65) synthase TruC [Alteromonadaceae bacterium M269]